MSADVSAGPLGEYLKLFARTEVFIYVFVEIVTKLRTIQRVIFKKASLRDLVFFIGIFGIFSIFGTYIGIPDSSGVISNIRDISPMVAGLVAGPVPGLAVGLIGGVHRYFLGGWTCFPCSLATVLSGLLAGVIHRLNKGKAPGIVASMLIAVALELLHAGLVLSMVRPFDAVLKSTIGHFPGMLIAVSLGVGISIIIIHHTKESDSPGGP